MVQPGLFDHLKRSSPRPRMTRSKKAALPDSTYHSTGDHHRQSNLRFRRYHCLIYLPASTISAHNEFTLFVLLATSSRIQEITLSRKSKSLFNLSILESTEAP